jgi:hypothetical protein
VKPFEKALIGARALEPVERVDGPLLNLISSLSSLAIAIAEFHHREDC